MPEMERAHGKQQNAQFEAPGIEEKI